LILTDNPIALLQALQCQPEFNHILCSSTAYHQKVADIIDKNSITEVLIYQDFSDNENCINTKLAKHYKEAITSKELYFNTIDKSILRRLGKEDTRNVILIAQLLQYSIKEDTKAVVDYVKNQFQARQTLINKKDRKLMIQQIIAAMQSAKHGYTQVQLRLFKENLQTNKIQLILFYKNSKICGGYYQKKTENGAIIRIPATELGIDFTISQLIHRDETILKN